MSRQTDFFGSYTGKTLAKNYLINGNFDVWQRGVTQTTSGYGSDDRWYNVYIGTTGVCSRQEFPLNQTDVPGNSRYYSRTVVTSVAGAGNYCQKIQSIESVRTLAGKKATVSFYAKADSVKNLGVHFLQIFGTGGSPTAPVAGSAQTVVLSSAWQKFVLTFNVPLLPSGAVLGTNLNDNLSLKFAFDSGSTYSWMLGVGQQSGTFDIAQVQVEEGSVATEFERRTYGEELALCQRYYQQYITILCGGYGTAGMVLYNSYLLAVNMRSVPVPTLLTVPGYSNSSGVGSWIPDAGRITIYVSITATGYGYTQVGYGLDAEL